MGRTPICSNINFFITLKSRVILTKPILLVYVFFPQMGADTIPNKDIETLNHFY